jgi:hypothetical protein
MGLADEDSDKKKKNALLLLFLHLSAIHTHAYIYTHVAAPRHDFLLHVAYCSPLCFIEVKGKRLSLLRCFIESGFLCATTESVDKVTLQELGARRSCTGGGGQRRGGVVGHIGKGKWLSGSLLFVLIVFDRRHL